MGFSRRIKKTMVVLPLSMDCPKKGIGADKNTFNVDYSRTTETEPADTSVAQRERTVLCLNRKQIFKVQRKKHQRKNSLAAINTAINRF